LASLAVKTVNGQLNHRSARAPSGVPREDTQENPHHGQVSAAAPTLTSVLGVLGGDLGPRNDDHLASVNAARQRGLQRRSVKEVQAAPGFGAVATVEGHRLAVGLDVADASASVPPPRLRTRFLSEQTAPRHRDRTAVASQNCCKWPALCE
jgi:hypothetical protein